MGRLRLISVAVQPRFVYDDGEHLKDMEHPVLVIPAAEWPAYSSDRFPRETAEWERALNEDSPAG